MSFCVAAQHILSPCGLCCFWSFFQLSTWEGTVLHPWTSCICSNGINGYCIATKQHFYILYSEMLVCWCWYYAVFFFAFKSLNTKRLKTLHNTHKTRLFGLSLPPPNLTQPAPPSSPSHILLHGHSVIIFFIIKKCKSPLQISTVKLWDKCMQCDGKVSIWVGRLLVTQGTSDRGWCLTKIDCKSTWHC